jgi:hypothetical protein
LRFFFFFPFYLLWTCRMHKVLFPGCVHHGGHPCPRPHADMWQVRACTQGGRSAVFINTSKQASKKRTFSSFPDRALLPLFGEVNKPQASNQAFQLLLLYISPPGLELLKKRKKDSKTVPNYNSQITVPKLQLCVGGQVTPQGPSSPPGLLDPLI